MVNHWRRIGWYMVGAAVAVSACSPEPAPLPDRSEATDVFYRSPDMLHQKHPALRLHEREPTRRFRSSLRPWPIEGTFPTAYLGRVTRNVQPYGNELYDIVYLGFDRVSLKPLPPERAAGFGSFPANRAEVLLQVGGWSQPIKPASFAAMAGIHRARIVENSPGHRSFATGKGEIIHFFSDPDRGNLAGQSLLVDCWSHVCRASLTVPMAGLRAETLRASSAPDAKGGLSIAVEFHPDQFAHWADIRRKAICLAQDAVPDLRLSDGGGRVGKATCADVWRAIRSRMAER